MQYSDTSNHDDQEPTAVHKIGAESEGASSAGETHMTQVLVANTERCQGTAEREDSRCENSPESKQSVWSPIQSVGSHFASIIGSRTVFSVHSVLPVFILVLLRRLHHGVLKRGGLGVNLSQVPLVGIIPGGDIVGDLIEGLTNAIFSIIEMIVGAFADKVGDKIADALMDVVLYTPLPEDSQGRPAIVTRPVNGPWPEVWDVFWGRFIVVAVILGLLLYAMANAISTIPFVPASVRSKFRGGLWRLLFGVPIIWPIMITGLYVMDVFIQIIAPSPDRLGVWVGGIITAALSAIAVSGPAAVIWGVLGMIQVTLLLFMLVLYIGRIIYLVFGVFVSPFAAMGLALQIPFIKGISKKILTGWVKIGLAPAISAGLFHIAVLFMTEPDGTGGWELADTWGPGGAGIFFDIGVGMLLPFFGIVSFFIAVTSSLPSSVSRGLGAAGVLSVMGGRRRGLGRLGSGKTAADVAKGGKEKLAEKTPSQAFASRGYSSSETLDAMTDQELQEFQDSTAYDPRDFMRNRIDSGGYTGADNLEDLVHQRRENDESSHQGVFDRAKDMDDDDVEVLQRMSEDELAEFAESDYDKPTEWIDEQIDSTTNARPKYQNVDDRDDWMDQREDDDKVWEHDELEDAYETVATNQDLDEMDHEIWKRMNPIEKRDFVNKYNDGDVKSPGDYVDKKIDGKFGDDDPAYNDLGSSTSYYLNRDKQSDADQWETLKDWDQSTSTGGQSGSGGSSGSGGQSGSSGSSGTGGNSSGGGGSHSDGSGVSSQTGATSSVNSSSSTPSGDRDSNGQDSDNWLSPEEIVSQPTLGTEQSPPSAERDSNEQDSDNWLSPEEIVSQPKQEQNKLDADKKERDGVNESDTDGEGQSTKEESTDDSPEQENKMDVEGSTSNETTETGTTQSGETPSDQAQIRDKSSGTPIDESFLSSLQDPTSNEHIEPIQSAVDDQQSDTEESRESDGDERQVPDRGELRDRADDILVEIDETGIANGEQPENEPNEGVVTTPSEQQDRPDSQSDESRKEPNQVGQGAESLEDFEAHTDEGTALDSEDQSADDIVDEQEITVRLHNGMEVELDDDERVNDFNIRVTEDDENDDEADDEADDDGFDMEEFEQELDSIVADVVPDNRRDTSGDSERPDETSNRGSLRDNGTGDTVDRIETKAENDIDNLSDEEPDIDPGDVTSSSGWSPGREAATGDDGDVQADNGESQLGDGKSSADEGDGQDDTGDPVADPDQSILTGDGFDPQEFGSDEAGTRSGESQGDSQQAGGTEDFKRREETQDTQPGQSEKEQGSTERSKNSGGADPEKETAPAENVEKDGDTDADTSTGGSVDGTDSDGQATPITEANLDEVVQSINEQDVNLETVTGGKEEAARSLWEKMSDSDKEEYVQFVSDRNGDSADLISFTQHKVGTTGGGRRGNIATGGSTNDEM